MRWLRLILFVVGFARGEHHYLVERGLAHDRTSGCRLLAYGPMASFGLMPLTRLDACCRHGVPAVVC